MEFDGESLFYPLISDGEFVLPPIVDGREWFFEFANWREPGKLNQPPQIVKSGSKNMGYNIELV